MSIRSGKTVPTETSRAASVVNEEETSWTDVNLDEQREDQQRPGNLLVFVLQEKKNVITVLLFFVFRFTAPGNMSVSGQAIVGRGNHQGGGSSVESGSFNCKCEIKPLRHLIEIIFQF